MVYKEQEEGKTRGIKIEAKKEAKNPEAHAVTQSSTAGKRCGIDHVHWPGNGALGVGCARSCFGCGRCGEAEAVCLRCSSECMPCVGKRSGQTGLVYYRKHTLYKTITTTNIY